MSLQIDPPFDLGQTLGVTSATDGARWVGVVKLFPDVNPLTGTIRSGRVKKCIAVRNSSGVTLYAKRGVSFAAGSLSAVDGYQRLDGNSTKAIAGVVDEYLPSTGVAANDVFWVTVEGPTEILVAVATTADDVLVGTTHTTAAATNSATTAGYAITANAATAIGVTAAGVVYGRALSTGASQVGCLALVGPRTLGD